MEINILILNIRSEKNFRYWIYILYIYMLFVLQEFICNFHAVFVFRTVWLSKFKNSFQFLTPPCRHPLPHPPPPLQNCSHFHERCAQCWIEWKINFLIIAIDVYYAHSQSNVLIFFPVLFIGLELIECRRDNPYTNANRKFINL